MSRPARFVFPNPPPVLGSPNFGNDAQGYLGAFPALRDYIEATADWYETDFAKSLPNGTAALPSLAFTSQANTGLYRPGTSVLAISVNGTERARFTTTGMQVGGSEVFRRANILGDVSQSAGVPTGAIIQRGSNANGEFVRFADGTQICWMEFTIDFAASIAIGENPKVVTYPATFSSVAPRSIQTQLVRGVYSVTTDSYFTSVNPASTTTFDFRARNSNPPASAVTATFTATITGRWF